MLVLSCHFLAVSNSSSIQVDLSSMELLRGRPNLGPTQNLQIFESLINIFEQYTHPVFQVFLPSSDKRISKLWVSFLVLWATTCTNVFLLREYPVMPHKIGYLKIHKCDRSLYLLPSGILLFYLFI